MHSQAEDVEKPDRVSLELLPLWFVVFDIRQTRDTVSLKAPMKRRAGRVRDRGLQVIKTVFQRQKCVPPECHIHRFLGRRQHSGPLFRRPGFHILDRRPLAPLGDCLGIDAKIPAQLREQSLPLSAFALQKPVGRRIAVF
jgi:hypothetical protein